MENLPASEINLSANEVKLHTDIYGLKREVIHLRAENEQLKIDVAAQLPKYKALRAENEALKANQNKLRAQAVRDALYAMDNMDSPCANDWLEYADKLERGEI